MKKKVNQMHVTKTRTLEFLVTAEVKRDRKKVNLAYVPESLDWETEGRFVEGDSTVKYALRCDNFTATLCIENEYAPDEPGVWDDDIELDGPPAPLLNQLIYQARAERHNASTGQAPKNPRNRLGR